MFSDNIEFDDAIVDNEYLRRKQEMAKRITLLRGQRTKLRQELSAYKKFEKSGEKPIDDPALVAKVMKLKSDLESEAELTTNLKLRMNNIKNQLTTVKKQIQDVTDLIQRYKMENAPDTISNSGMDHLRERKALLEQTFIAKEKKKLDLENDVARITKESDIKNKQNEVITQISTWQQGNSAEPTDPSFVQQAFQAYETSTKNWREAKFHYDRKNIMPDFYLYSIKALIQGIDAHYLLLIQADADISNINIQEKIDLLYKNKIVVNTTLLNSLLSFVDRINHNVEVSPTPNYPDKIFEFMQKNMTSLKTI